MRLDGKKVIIVGAGQSPSLDQASPAMGNGRATALLFARHGADVMCVDRTIEAADETAQLIRVEGGNAHAHAADVSREADMAAMVTAAHKQWGRIDILHYNVGVSLGGGDQSPLEITEAAFDNVTAINLRGFVMACKHVLPIMRDQRAGVILSISSVAALSSTYPTVAYKTKFIGLFVQDDVWPDGYAHGRRHARSRMGQIPRRNRGFTRRQGAASPKNGHRVGRRLRRIVSRI